MGKRVKTDSKHGKQVSRKKVPSEQTGGSAWGKKVSEWFAGQKQKIDVRKGGMALPPLYRGQHS